jgi:hypothetical protein
MEPNHSTGILLYEDRLGIGCQNRVQDCLCRVTFDLTRKHHVLIDCLESLHPLVGILMPGQQFQITLPGAAGPIECHVFGTFKQQIIGNDPSLYLTFVPLGNNVFIESGSKVQTIDGGIVNFNQYYVGNDQVIRLDDGTWKFELTPISESGSYPAEIQNQSYLFTHRLNLQRSDGKTFSWSQAQFPLEILSTFLSFCAERCVAPTLLKGYDRSGGVVVQDWRAARIDSYKRNGNWLDEYHGGAMPEAFPGFAHLMRDAEWKEAIRSAVYWYVRGDTNFVGPDGAIILIQTALEKLAWHILVRVKRSIAARSFSDLPVADQLRLVLDTCSVPLDLPPRLPNLTAAATGQKGEQDWVDGPQAFTAVRNQIVHPGKRKRVRGGRTFLEALYLGKWYLELILLHSFGFRGNYTCRLDIPMHTGNVEPVPWATPEA